MILFFSYEKYFPWWFILHVTNIAQHHVFVREITLYEISQIQLYEIFHAHIHLMKINVLFILLHAFHHMISRYFLSVICQPLLMSHASIKMYWCIVLSRGWIFQCPLSVLVRRFSDLCRFHLCCVQSFFSNSCRWLEKKFPKSIKKFSKFFFLSQLMII